MWYAVVRFKTTIRARADNLDVLHDACPPFHRRLSARMAVQSRRHFSLLTTDLKKGHLTAAMKPMIESRTKLFVGVDPRVEHLNRLLTKPIEMWKSPL